MKITKHIRAASTALIIVSSCTHTARAADGWLGELAPLAYRNANTNSGGNVAAVQTSGTPLSEGDRQLLGEIAIHGIRQIELSKAAASLSPSDDVRQIAKGEIDEHTAIADKLKEIALAGGATLPTEADAETKTLVENLRTESGPGFDRAYLKKCGIAGHEQLLVIMEKTRAEAKDSALRELAFATLPLIHTHLRVARVELSEMK